jgi:hypothetical protein
MGSDHSHGVGIRFTWRHAVILSAYLAILFLLLIPFFERNGQLGTQDVVRATLMVSPPLLALLVLAIESTGPVKNWTVSILLFLFYPSLLLNHDYNVLLNIMKYGRPPWLWVTLLINAVVATYALVYARRLAPRTCPGCQRRTLVPLMRLFKDEKRSSNTFWCASCGAKFWKDNEGKWRIEKRTTWVDGHEKGHGAGKPGEWVGREHGAEPAVPPPPADRGSERGLPRERPQAASSDRE